MDICQICKDTSDEPLHDIILCQCKYKCHNSCWIDYVHSQKKLKCLMCRNIITSNNLKSKNNNYDPVIVRPSAPILQPSIYNQNQDILTYYQRFNDNDNNYNQRNDVRIIVKRSTQENIVLKNKIKKILEALCIITVIIIIIIIIVVFV